MGNMVAIAIRVNDIPELEKQKYDIDILELMYGQTVDRYKDYGSNGIIVSNYYNNRDNVNLLVSDKGIKALDYVNMDINIDKLVEDKPVKSIVPNLIACDYKKDLSFNELKTTEKDNNRSKIAVFGILTDDLDLHATNNNFVSELIRMSKALVESPILEEQAKIESVNMYTGIATLGVVCEKNDMILNLNKNIFTSILIPAKQFDLDQPPNNLKEEMKKSFNIKLQRPTLKP